MTPRGLRHLRRIFPPDGPRYELVDTSLAIAWIVWIAYVAFPAPPVSRRALGAPLRVISEHDLGVIVGGMLLTATALSYFPVRVFTFRGELRMVHPVRIGYQIARSAVAFMALNFGISSMFTALDLYSPDSWAWAHRFPPIPSADSEATLRAALIYFMVYGYAFRRLKRDNRIPR